MSAKPTQPPAAEPSAPKPQRPKSKAGRYPKDHPWRRMRSATTRRAEPAQRGKE
jgi:hypothetical protein